MDILNVLIKLTRTNQFILIMIYEILLDTILGSARAIKEKKFNSSVGIDGAIRKTTMIICIMFSILIDIVIQINLIGFMPEALRESIGMTKIGLAEFFSILYIVYESISILKNMLLCGLPIPTKIKEFLCMILNTMTDEISKKDG